MNLFKTFGFFDKKQRFLMLVMILVVQVSCVIIIFTRPRLDPWNAEDMEQRKMQKKTNSSYFSRADQDDSGTNPTYLAHDHRHIIYDEQIDRLQVRYTFFDPNTADSTLLLSLGLQDWQVRSIYRYRSRGGVFRKKNDFAKLYGLTVKQYKSLEPYIRISEDYRPASTLCPQSAKTEMHETSRSSDMAQKSHPHKLNKGETVPLNTADTTLLQTVPGIGSYYARQIVRYRERLGGFVDVNQLKEIEGFPIESIPFMRINADEMGKICKININTTPLIQLRKHPYINYYQAKAICDYRRLKGTITDLRQLALLPDFDAKSLQQLAPYLTY